MTPRVAVETEVLRVTPPPGSQFKGYERYHGAGPGADAPGGALSARALADAGRGDPGGAALPAGIRGHFGPELRRFVLMQYHQGQVTVERLVAQLQAIGISISKRQVMRLLIAGQDDFLAETREVLRVGLQTAPGSRWTTPARATAASTASARRSATTASLGSARRAARAG